MEEPQEQHTTQASDKKHGCAPEALLCDGIDNGINRGLHTKDALVDPCYGSQGSDECAGNPKYGIEAFSTHDEKRGQDSSDYQQLHRLNPQVEGENSSQPIPVIESEPSQGGGEGQSMDQAEESRNPRLFTWEDRMQCVDC